MNTTKIISFVPEELKTNTPVIINYFGNLNNSQQIYIEYFYDDISNSNTSIIKAKMSKVIGYSFVFISVEGLSKIFFRFVDENGNIDDNFGAFYQKDIGEVPSEISSVPEGQTPDNTSYLEEFEESSNMALVPIKESSLTRKGLRFSYKLNKRIKLLLIKLFRKLPSFITGNYRRRINL